VIADALLRAWVLGYAAAAVTAVVRAATRSRSRARARRGTLASLDVVLVRPLAGDETGLEERLARTGGATFVVLAVGSREDPAEPVAQAAAARLRARGVNALALVTNAVGPNHKADQLARALATPLAEQARFVVVADSDVELEDDSVEELVHALEGADAAWAPPAEHGPISTWGDRASQAVLDASLHSFPLLAGIDPKGLVGKLFAVRREALAAAGGFGALTAYLGEDMELGRRLRAAGKRVVVAPLVARSMARGRRLNDVLARYTRWLLVVRSQRPHLLLSYPLLLAPSPALVVVLVFCAAAQHRALATAAIAGLAVRMGVALAARVAAGLPLEPMRAVVQALSADLVLLIAMVRACSSSEVVWRGRRLTLTRSGTLVAACSGGQETHEETLGEPPEDAGASREDRVEAVGRRRVDRAGPRGDGGVDTRELLLDSLALADHAGRHVAVRVLRSRERTSERDPESGVLGGTEDVAKADRDDARAPGDPRDLRRARTELERLEGRTLAALGEDPERATRRIEEARGMANGASAVAGVVEVHAERADTPEEGHTSEVRRIHHRVTVAAEEELGDVEGDERVPPRGVVRDEEQRRAGGGGPHGVETGDLDAAEGPPDARAGVAREPGIEPAALGGADHKVTS
jgi:ceramide glucosyltransferase